MSIQEQLRLGRPLRAFTFIINAVTATPKPTHPDVLTGAAVSLSCHRDGTTGTNTPQAEAPVPAGGPHIPHGPAPAPPGLRLTNLYYRTSPPDAQANPQLLDSKGRRAMACSVRARLLTPTLPQHEALPNFLSLHEFQLRR